MAGVFHFLLPVRNSRTLDLRAIFGLAIGAGWGHDALTIRRAPPALDGLHEGRQWAEVG